MVRKTPRWAHIKSNSKELLFWFKSVWARSLSASRRKPRWAHYRKLPKGKLSLFKPFGREVYPDEGRKPRWAHSKKASLRKLSVFKAFCHAERSEASIQPPCLVSFVFTFHLLPFTFHLSPITFHLSHGYCTCYSPLTLP